MEEKAASSKVDCQDILEGGVGEGGGRGVKTSHRSIAIENREYPTDMKISQSIFYFHPIHNMLLKWHKRIDPVKRLFVSSKLVFTQVFQKSRFCVGTHSFFQPSPLTSQFYKNRVELGLPEAAYSTHIAKNAYKHKHTIRMHSLPILIHKIHVPGMSVAS